MSTQIVDYDTPGYDYRRYWEDRDYERRAEKHALDRLMRRVGRSEWFVDLGGGFGRNAEHYRRLAGHYVVADFSATNLANAADLLSDDVAAGRAFLVRCDLHALPFADGAFDAGLAVRVLHHLVDLDDALPEMARVIADRWLIDVPIKHHAWAVLRGAARGEGADLYSAAPLRTGVSADPFWNFRLSEVRRLLKRSGWHTELMASVNNLRRWDRRMPAHLVRALTPAALAVEAVAQRAGRGWWGPSQFVLARRDGGRPVPVSSDAGGLTSRMICPACRGTLRWNTGEAACTICDGRYPRTGAVWNFTTPGGAR
jgi:SAM-dependent methyltransferase